MALLITIIDESATLWLINM